MPETPTPSEPAIVSTDGLHAAAEDPARYIGARLRALRQHRGLGLRETARRANISHGLLSQVETGRTRPSIATLSRIASVLGITLFDAVFTATDPIASRLVRRQERRSLASPAQTIQDWLLTPTNAGSFAVYFTVVQPGATSGGQYSHLGGQEFIYIVRGTLEFGVGHEVWELREGDAVTLDAKESHHWRNRWQEPAEIIWILENSAEAKTFPLAGH